MANVAYALMVRDLSLGIDRSRLDRALSGEIQLGSQPEMDHIQSMEDMRRQMEQQQSPSLSHYGPVRSKADLEKLRETWGASPDAIRAKLEFDATLQNLPPMKPGG